MTDTDSPDSPPLGDPPAAPPERIVSWAEVQTDTRALARRLLGEAAAHASWKGIVAITRGGMVPAAVLAREMGIRVIDTLSIASYDEQSQGQVRVLKAPAQAVADGGDGWLLVDDLVDTGVTARAARELLPGAHFVTLYAKPQARDLPDAFVHEVAQEVWIHFPWDTEERAGGLAYAPPLAHLEKT
ncbi:MAG: xanthine phosphoribosyltransferase [Rhodospirillaceae bacterium]|nr:xanthine phosphoribosyltransferase [Rhodospirillaceae bacterium]